MSYNIKNNIRNVKVIILVIILSNMMILSDNIGYDIKWLYWLWY